jgi:hypothetical protein
MKILKLAILQIALLSGNIGVGQTIVSTEVENRVPVIYDFTGIHCTSCPNAHHAIEVAKGHYPEIVALSFHTGQFAVPNVEEPDFRTLQGDSVFNKFAYFNPEDETYGIVWSFPTVSMNGIKIQTSVINDTTQFLEKINEVLGEDAIVNIGAIASIDTLNRKLKLEVECFYTSPATDSNYLVVSLTQNGLMSTQAGAGDNYVHKEMFRCFISNTWGDTLGVPQEGDLVQKTYSLDLPDSIKYDESDAIELTLRNIQIQVYVTGHDTLVTAYDFFGVPYKNRKTFDVLNGINADIEYVEFNGIKTGRAQFKTNVYPNPAKQYINIEIPPELSKYHIWYDILDINGQLIKTRKYPGMEKSGFVQISIQDLKKGIYLIRMYGNHTYSVNRFVVE